MEVDSGVFLNHLFFLEEAKHLLNVGIG